MDLLCVHQDYTTHYNTLIHTMPMHLAATHNSSSISSTSNEAVTRKEKKLHNEKEEQEDGEKEEEEQRDKRERHGEISFLSFFKVYVLKFLGRNVFTRLKHTPDKRLQTVFFLFNVKKAIIILFWRNVKLIKQ